MGVISSSLAYLVGDGNCGADDAPKQEYPELQRIDVRDIYECDAESLPKHVSYIEFARKLFEYVTNKKPFYVNNKLPTLLDCVQLAHMHRKGNDTYYIDVSECVGASISLALKIVCVNNYGSDISIYDESQFNQHFGPCDGTNEIVEKINSKELYYIIDKGNQFVKLMKFKPKPKITIKKFVKKHAFRKRYIQIDESIKLRSTTIKRRHSINELVDLLKWPYRWEQYQSLQDLIKTSTLGTYEDSTNMASLWLATGLFTSYYKPINSYYFLESEKCGTGCRVTWKDPKTNKKRKGVLTCLHVCAETMKSDSDAPCDDFEMLARAQDRKYSPNFELIRVGFKSGQNGNNLDVSLNMRAEDNQTRIESVDSNLIDAYIVYQDNGANVEDSNITLDAPNSSDELKTNNVYACGYPSGLNRGRFGVLQNDTKTLMRFELQLASTSKTFQSAFSSLDRDTIGFAQFGGHPQFSGMSIIACDAKNETMIPVLGVFLETVEIRDGIVTVELDLFSLRNINSACEQFGGNKNDITQYYEKNFGKDILLRSDLIGEDQVVPDNTNKRQMTKYGFLAAGAVAVTILAYHKSNEITELFGMAKVYFSNQ